MDYDTFRHNLIAGATLGVYDGRMSALVGSPLDADDEPSNTFVGPGFAAGSSRCCRSWLTTRPPT